jgi:hypothetical protein
MSINQDLLLEFGRLALVYVHLIACCVALGLVLSSDVAMLRALLQDDPSSRRKKAQNLHNLQNVVYFALVALWATGTAIVTLDALVKGGWGYFANPKIQAKILVVFLLTVNGVLLHTVVLPWMEKAGSLLNMSFRQTIISVVAGVISGVSWLYAAFMGVGRPLAWKYSLLELMAAWPMLVMGGFMGMLLLVTWCKYRNEEGSSGQFGQMAAVHA